MQWKRVTNKLEKIAILHRILGSPRLSERLTPVKQLIYMQSIILCSMHTMSLFPNVST